MKVADGVEMLEISALVMGEQNVINPTVIRDKDELILVDAAFPGQLPKLREAIEKSGMPFDKLSKVIITHHDIDHIGGLSAVLNAMPQKIEVLAHQGEKPYIQGELRPVKLTPERMAQLNSLPEEQSQAIKKAFESFKKLGAMVDRTVADGEELPYCGGITVIHTPGHSPGHICLYLKLSKTLIAGDALFAEGGALVPAPQFLNHDSEAAVKSLKKLTSYDIKTVICYHGGLYQNNPNRCIAELAHGGTRI
jgi:glyoxylase-like metal-dependent hydrolase (beta-lactamase superfamily II)